MARYRKIHLFDIITPDGTGLSRKRHLRRRRQIVTYEAAGVKVGCAICYDVRFPELFLALRRAGAELDLPALGLHRGDRHAITGSR